MRRVGMTISSGGRLVQRETWNIAEVVRVQGPELRAPHERACGDGDVDLTLSCARHATVQLGREDRFCRAERPRFGGRDHNFLGRNLAGTAGTALPFIDDEC